MLVQIPMEHLIFRTHRFSFQFFGDTARQLPQMENERNKIYSPLTVKLGTIHLTGEFGKFYNHELL